MRVHGGATCFAPFRFQQGDGLRQNVRRLGVLEDNFLRCIGLIAASFIAGSIKHCPVVAGHRRIRQSHGFPKQIGFQFFPDGHVSRFNHFQKGHLGAIA